VQNRTAAPQDHHLNIQVSGVQNQDSKGGFFSGASSNTTNAVCHLGTDTVREDVEKLAKEPLQVNLAVSLNATTDEVRDEIMPINRKWNIGKLMAALKAYPLEQRRRITFEYVLLAGVNDSLRDAAQLAKLLRGVKCKVNIIPWNPHPEAPYERPAPAVIDAFQNECKRLGLPTYLRTPRGDDIDAACGQLANRSNGSPIVPLRVRKEPPPPPPVE